MTETIEPVLARIDQQQLAHDLVEAARTKGVDLVGPGGLLTGLTKTVLETALEAEISEHLGCDKHDPVGRNRGNSRNGTRTKTVLTEIGPIEVEVPRDRAAVGQGKGRGDHQPGLAWGVDCRRHRSRCSSAPAGRRRHHGTPIP